MLRKILRKATTFLSKRPVLRRPSEDVEGRTGQADSTVQEGVAGDVQAVAPSINDEIAFRQANIMYAGKTADSTVVVLGAEPLSTTMTLLLSHRSTLCGVVRNIAGLMARSYPGDSDLLTRLSKHGGVDEPESEPFSILLPGTQREYAHDSTFVAQLSQYEVAQICASIDEMFNDMQANGIPYDEGFVKVHGFWQKIWASLSDAEKMSALQDVKGSTLAN